MLITDCEALTLYDAQNRIWQGIPAIEVTKRGRVFSTFYSGGVQEGVGNFVLLLRSDDGVDFGKPIAVAFEEGYARCYDPGLWIDPLGRLWFWWAQAPHNAVHAVICEDPDAETLVWSEERIIGREVMMNKPTVLSTGEWLFPIAVWAEHLKPGWWKYATEEKERLAYVYRTADHGKSFVRLGGADVPKRSYDEHMIVERCDGTLDMYVRTKYGIGISSSVDGGLHWSRGGESGLSGPCSRFFIGRLSSGKLLLINHSEYTGRNNLTAFLSDDDGKTWKWKLLLDGRGQVSYPDVTERNGYLYITYDRERGCFKHSIKDAYDDAREILYAKITEADIMAGELVNCESFLQRVISRLDTYAKEQSNPYFEVGYLPAETVAESLADVEDCETVLQKLFEQYSMNCINMHRLDSCRLDELIEKWKQGEGDKTEILCSIVTLIRAASDEERELSPIIVSARSFVESSLDGSLNVREIAEHLGISTYYLSHLFKRETGTTLVEYIGEQRMTRAKRMLVQSDASMTEIAQKCGFSDSSYFAKCFSGSMGMTPGEYRALQKNMK